MAVVDVNAIRLVVLQQCLHDFVIFSPGDGLGFTGVSVCPETPVLKFTEHLRLQYDRTPAPFGRIHARLFRCHRPLSPSSLAQPDQTSQANKGKTWAGWFSSPGSRRCPGFSVWVLGRHLPFVSPRKWSGQQHTCLQSRAVPSRSSKNVTSSHHRRRSREGGCPIRWAGYLPPVRKRSPLTGRLRGGTTVFKKTKKNKNQEHTKAWKHPALSVPIDLLSNRHHYFRMRAVQPLKKAQTCWQCAPAWPRMRSTCATWDGAWAPHTCLNATRCGCLYPTTQAASSAAEAAAQVTHRPSVRFREAQSGKRAGARSNCTWRTC